MDSSRVSLPSSQEGSDTSAAALLDGFWTCWGRWLEVCTYQAGGDITGVDLTLWAKWYGEHMDPADAVIRYRCATEGHEFAYEPHQDGDEAPRCTHCGEERP